MTVSVVTKWATASKMSPNSRRFKLYHFYRNSFNLSNVGIFFHELNCVMYFFIFFGMFDQYLLLSFILEVTEVKITFVALLILLYNMQITKCHGCLLQVLVMLDAVIFLLYAFLAV